MAARGRRGDPARTRLSATTSADTCGLDVQIRVQSDTRKCSEHTRYPFFGLALPILKTKTEEDQKNKNKNAKQTEKDREKSDRPQSHRAMLSSHFERADEARPVLAVKHRCSPRVRTRHGETVRSNVRAVLFPSETGPR